MVVDKTQAMVVREIFETYVQSKSRDCFAPLCGARNDLSGHGISKGCMAYMLRNPIYTGKIKYAGKLYQGIHPPIISDDLFNLAQTIHKKKTRTMRLYKEYALGSLIRCKECGSLMTPCHTNKIKKNKRIRYYYYRCTKTFKKDWGGCNIRQVSANRLEDYIYQNLERVSLDKHYIDSLIFKLNNTHTSERAGLELTDESSKISSDLVQQNLKILIDGASKITEIDKNIWYKKFIKGIDYSKEEIVISLYYLSGFEKEAANIPASGRVGAAAGRKRSLPLGKKIPLISRDKGKDKNWLRAHPKNPNFSIIIYVGLNYKRKSGRNSIIFK
ncbi:recombinase zinc beta ribbon domain-containing protein [Candidatus Omnitrophota bacterium]